MPFADSTLHWQRWVLAAMFLGSAVLMVPGGILTEPFMLPKITFMLLCAVGLLGLGAARAAWTRSASIPTSPLGLAALAFGGALLLSTAISDSPWTSVVGYFSRYTGLVPYLVHLTALLVALRLTTTAYAQTLARTGVVGLTVVVGYGLFQAAGLDPVEYGDVSLGRTFSTMGNTNFGGAWAGAVLALAVAVAACRSEERGWRVWAAVLVPAALGYGLLTGTSQGVIVPLVAGGTAAALIASEPGSAVRAWVSSHRGAAAAGTAGAVLVLGALAAVGAPFAKAQLSQALVERPSFWRAALAVWQDHPVLGTGLDTFAHYFLRYRPAEHAVVHGPATTDAPHSVPLGMLANGGALLFLAWLAVVVVTLVAVVQGARRLRGPARVWFAGFAGVWAGYQVQALVSFDEPPLALLHFLSAGVLVALATTPGRRAVRLPGRPVEQKRNKRGKPTGVLVVPTSTRLLLGAVVVLGLVAVWFGAYPLRADRVAASAAPLTASGRLDEASERFDRASDLNPAEARYAFIDAQVHAKAGRGEAAVASALLAARRDPGPVEYVLFAARQAEAVGRADEARDLFAEALARDPRDPAVINEVAVKRLEAADLAGAVELLERSAALKDDTETLVLLAQARLQLSDTEGARDALRTALVIQPANQPAAELLEQIDRSSPGT